MFRTTIIAVLCIYGLILSIKADSEWLPYDVIPLCHQESMPDARSKLHKSQKIQLIVDTDLGMFPDDPVAFAIVHGMADNGRANILATVGSTKYEGIALGIDTLNTFLGRPNIPIGVTRDPKAYSDPQGTQNWTEFARTNFPHKITLNSEVEDAVLIYRKMLANAADHSVTVLQVGHFINLVNLLDTPADAISSLNGKELVKRKVRQVLTMAGKFPSGTEWNIEMNTESALAFSNQWPTRVTFVGFEIGHVTCGTKYQHVPLSHTNPLAAFSYFGYQKYGNFNGCFDAVAALILDPEIAKLHCAVLGKIKINLDGSNEWINGTKLQRYLKRKNSEKIITHKIDDYFTSIKTATKSKLN